MQQYRSLHILLIRICLLAGLWATALPAKGQKTFPPGVEVALRQAGANRPSLEKMLRHYRKAPNPEKYRAACFLVEHMPLHAQGGRIVSYDRRIDSLRRAAESTYYRLICGTTAEEQESDPLHKTLIDSARAARERAQALTYSEPRIEVGELPDIETVSGEYLRKHIDLAFSLRAGVKRIRNMRFEDFCQYFLPYRAIGEYPLLTPADQLARIYRKYLQADTAVSMVRIAERYNRVVYWMREWHGQYPYESTIGFPELFWQGFHDCIDIANYGALILRACGVPAAVEYNAGYKSLPGQHYMVAIPDEHGRWRSFSPESSVPVDDKSGYLPSLNFFRLHFCPQADNPAALAAPGEPVPELLADPCIKDVTDCYLRTVSLTLPAGSLPAGRNVAYLASFSAHEGIREITWGRADSASGSILFKHVVGDHFYFPVYCDSQRRLKPIGRPFYLHYDSARAEGYALQPLAEAADRRVAVTLERKYPRKPHLLLQARAAVGTCVIAADTPDFSNADTIGVITQVPDDVWTDLPLKPLRPYRYYRVKAPAADPHLHLAELQFLAHKRHRYANIMAPTPSQAAGAGEDYDRLMDEPLEKCRWKSEYDGNVQTAPDSWPDVTLRLNEPQWVECLRYIVKNADNRIKAGDKYCLKQWNADGWQEIWSKTAAGNTLDAGELQVGGLYWLLNLDHGQEEMPFIVNETGEVRFLTIEKNH